MGREHNDRPAGCEAQRVAQQVVHRLADPVRVDARPQVRRDIDAAGQAGPGQPGPGEFGTAGEQRPQCGLLQLEAEPVFVTAGEQQQVAGDPGQPVGFGGRASYRGGQFLTAASGPLRELEFAAEHRERRAQLVAGVRDERPLPRSARWSRPSRSFIVAASAAISSLVAGTSMLDSSVLACRGRADSVATCRLSRSTGDKAARASQ